MIPLDNTDNRDENVLRVLQPGHVPEHLPPTEKKQKPQKRCKVCRMKGAGRRESRFYCPDCPSKPGLCFPQCFRAYHSQRKYWT